MARVYLGLGSNVNPAANLRLAVRELRRRFGELALSSVYQSAPLGFQGDDFLNAVVGLDTALPPREIPPLLEQIHAAAGRSRDETLGSRTLDIDLLLYDRLVMDEPGLRLPRKDVLDYNFVLKPLAELAPEYVHPLTGDTLASHWRRLDRNEMPAGWHPLTPVDIQLGD